MPNFAPGEAASLLIHREVATASNGLVESLKVERRQVPDAVVTRAECNVQLEKRLPALRPDSRTWRFGRFANANPEDDHDQATNRHDTRIHRHWRRGQGGITIIR